MAISRYRVVLTDSALTDLEEIYVYIKERLMEKNIAARLIDRIEKEILLLESSPHRCIEVIVKPHKRKFRKLVVGKYIVIYRINESNKEVIIDSVIYGKRDYLL